MQNLTISGPGCIYCCEVHTLKVQRFGPQPQQGRTRCAQGSVTPKATDGVFWSILSSVIHTKNLSLHPCSLGGEQPSPQYFLPFQGCFHSQGHFLILCFQPSSQAPPTSHSHPAALSPPRLLLRTPVPLPACSEAHSPEPADFTEGEWGTI